MGLNIGKTIKNIFKNLLKSIIMPIVKPIIRFGLFVKNLFVWIGAWVVCSFNKILRLPECFLWYFLDFLGFIIYLPFRMLFAFIDYFIFPGFNDIVYSIWCFLYSIDDASYKSSGFHFMHYPDEILDTCYRCGAGPFPKY